MPLILIFGLCIERAIKPFVIGRKNWLTNGSLRGAAASCAIYSLVETAGQNGLDPFSYLHYVFQQAPRIITTAGRDDLLPGNLTAEKLAAALPTPLAAQLNKAHHTGTC